MESWNKLLPYLLGKSKWVFCSPRLLGCIYNTVNHDTGIISFIVWFHKMVYIPLSYLQQCKNELSFVLYVTIKAKLRQRRETVN